MKHFKALALFGTFGALVACSGSGDDGTDGTDGTGGTATGGAATGGAATGGAATGGAATGGAGTGGAATGGAATGGAGTGGSENPDAVVLECGDHTYTPAGTSTGSGCGTVAVPSAPGLVDFEATEQATFLRHYAQATPAGTITDPASFTDGDAAGVNRVAGGANDTGYSIHYAGSGWTGDGADEDGIRVAASFPTCNDVRTFEGISFWAKGTLAASDDYGGIPANTVILIVSDGSDYIDTRVTLSADWKEYRIPFDCMGDTSQASLFEGYIKSYEIVFRSGTFDVSIDEISYY